MIRVITDGTRANTIIVDEDKGEKIDYIYLDIHMGEAIGYMELRTKWGEDAKIYNEGQFEISNSPEDLCMWQDKDVEPDTITPYMDIEEARCIIEDSTETEHRCAVISRHESPFSAVAPYHITYSTNEERLQKIREQAETIAKSGGMENGDVITFDPGGSVEKVSFKWNGYAANGDPLLFDHPLKKVTGISVEGMECPVDLSNEEESCPECFGTGYANGIGMPCSRNCKPK